VLPGSDGHRAIMGLCLAAGNCVEFHRGSKFSVDCDGAEGL
jgi:hypothetical protein